MFGIPTIRHNSSGLNLIGSRQVIQRAKPQAHLVLSINLHNIQSKFRHFSVEMWRSQVTQSHSVFVLPGEPSLNIEVIYFP